MGHLDDNTPPGSFYVICQEVYPLRLVVYPGFASDQELSAIVKDVLPDVQDWQFSGRRYRLLPQPHSRVIHPAGYAQNSRKMRTFQERVVFGFHSALQRDAVVARFSNLGYKFEIVNEP